MPQIVLGSEKHVGEANIFSRCSLLQERRSEELRPEYSINGSNHINLHKWRGIPSVLCINGMYTLFIRIVLKYRRFKRDAAMIENQIQVLQVRNVGSSRPERC
jgi:hypothetical protein